MTSSSADDSFPCSLIILVPFPTTRLASCALRALEVDAELSPLVRRSFSLESPQQQQQQQQLGRAGGASKSEGGRGTTDFRKGNSILSSSVMVQEDDQEKTILRTDYKAMTNRMLRVAVNGFMESMGVVLRIMEELDVDVLAESLKSVEE